MQLHEVRKKVRESLPSEAFQPQPIRGIIFTTVHFPLAIILAWILIHYSLPWYVSLLLSVIISQIYTVGGYVAHEAIHGAIYRSNRGQYFLGFLGFLPFFIAPTLWKFWHCQCHHGHTNFVEGEP